MTKSIPINFIKSGTASLIISCSVIIALPFILFYWMIPFFSHLTLGNDYQKYFIEHQLELMFSLKTGSFPLYIPGFCGGQSSAALVLGQIFHPISHLASMMPGYWEGKALEWNTLLKFFSLSGTHLALFFFLKRIKINSLLAFCLSTITVYNLAMLSMFDLGSALESWTAHLLLCTSIGWYYLKPTKLTGPLCIIAATYLLICSGHPQFMYYGLLGAGFFTLAIPYFIESILPEYRIDNHRVIRFWFHTGMFFSIGLLLSSAFITSFYFEFIATNTSRVGQNYAWADTYRDTFMGTINNFFYPLRSGNSGAFGGTPFFLIAALTPVAGLCKKIKIPVVIWIVWGVCLLIFLHMQGGRLPIHYFVWKYFPLAASFRIPGRISMMLPIFFLMLLIWLIQSDKIKISVMNKNIVSAPIIFPAAASLILLCTYLCLPDSITSDTFKYNPTAIRMIPGWVEGLVLFLSIAILFILTIYIFAKKTRTFSGVFLCILCCAQLMLTFYYGTWIGWYKKETPSYSKMLSQKKERLDFYSDDPGSGLYKTSVFRQCKNSCLEPFLGKVYTKFVAVDTNKESYTLMAKGRTPDTLIVEKYPHNHKFVASSNPPAKWPNTVQLNYSSFNRLVFETEASRPGFFELAYPNSKNWEAWVNNQEVPIYQANGYAMAVDIPSGRSKVEFRYWSSAFFWGMLVSCITFMIIGFVISFQIFNKPFNHVVGGTVIILTSAFFFFWYHSLYHGNNLKTEYAWQPDASMNFNIAYGKRTKTSSDRIWLNPTIVSGGRAVDGDRSLNSGFLVEKQNKPWWIVDLYRPMEIKAIKIYESKKGMFLNNVNTRPLYVAFSNDQKNWKAMEIKGNKRPLILDFDDFPVARYVMLQASGICNFAIDEVEIFSPPAKVPE